MKTNVHLFLLYIYGGEIPFYLYLYDKLFLAHVVSDGHADTSSLKNLEGSVDYLYIQFCGLYAISTVSQQSQLVRPYEVCYYTTLLGKINHCKSLIKQVCLCDMSLHSTL